MSFSVRERRERERKRRLRSLVLSLIIPGTGQLASGRISIGIAGLALDVLFVLLPLLVIPQLKANEYPQYVFLVWLLGGIAFALYYAFMAYDTYRGTRLELSPCRRDCPADINVPDYVALVAAGRWDEADELIRERAPLAGTLGRICPAPCEKACTRTRIEEPIAIRALKRSAQERSNSEKRPRFPVRYRQKIAVIGAGPSGLSCAYFLSRRGYPVDIYDKEKTPGGLLYSSIPCFRLPRDVLESDIDFILSSSDGIRFIGNKELGKDLDLAELENSYSAVYLALGASKPRPLMLKGENLKGVVAGLDFLHEVCTAKKPISIKGEVVVLGGGNTAVDSARTALRLGAKKVSVFYRRMRDLMPAYDEEIAEAEAEGVRFEFLASPLEFKGKTRVEKVRFTRMKLRDHRKGRNSGLEAVEEDAWEAKADMVIVAVGQEADYHLIKELTIASDLEGKIKVHRNHLRTNRRKVFAGGDVVHGPGSVVEAVADGRKAAQRIISFLHPRFLGRLFERLADFDPDFGVEKVDGAAWRSRAPEVKKRSKERSEHGKISLKREAMCGLVEGEDREEAKRCLRCQRYNIGFAYKKGKQKEYVSLDERK
ncbi:FAD-dependent oxidoreductase [candidate division WOR-3 bacterium]|nr:FAD-dependent oxidoreductase [candidate division WOR-3 bacterium]